MNKVIIDDVCNITTGNLDSNAFVPEGKYPFYTCAKDPLSIDTYAFNDDVVLVAGNNAKGNFHVNRYTGKFNAYQRTYVISSKGSISIDYIYYILKLALKSLKDKSQGSQTKFLTIGIIKNIVVPDLSNSNEVSKILSTIDKKIELNKKINQELEEISKKLYDYWFVQFDFPNENGNPYKSSGGRMTYNEVLKREIPTNWKDCVLDDVVERTGTGLNPRKNFKLGEGNNYYVTIKNIEQGKVILDSKCDKISDEALEIINDRSDLKIGDILYTSIQPVGITYLLREKPRNWNINESVFVISPNYKKVSSEFLYMFLSGDYIKAYTNNVSAGSIHKGIRHETLRDCKFILPDKDVIDNFTKNVRPILNKLDLIQRENQKLTDLRDWLLPMLMNGQVSIVENSNSKSK